MKALVIYGTRWGGTVKVAQAIGAALSDEGIPAEIVDAKDAPSDIGGYDLIVVGSGMRADKWTKESIEFLSKNKQTLQTKKTALFVSCQMADRKDQKREEAKCQYLQKTADEHGLQPLALGYFGGYLDFSHSHGLVVDIMVRVNRKSLRRNGLDTTRIHDTRDWAGIEVWARSLAKAVNEAE
ncbi:MAG: nitric oxide synthase [Candidatus Bathyarchaeota archaeon]|nr:nitric oxide synthase [Candidatus Bathyarchaeota archaeon]